MKLTNSEIEKMELLKDSSETAVHKSLDMIQPSDSLVEKDMAASVKSQSSQILTTTPLDSSNPSREDASPSTHINIQNNIIIVAPRANSLSSFVDDFAVTTSPVIARPRREVLYSLELGKPKTKAYFRVHPDDAYSMEVMILKYNEGLYLVSKSIQEKLAPELIKMKLFLYVTQDGILGIWPIKVPGSGNSKEWIDPYNRSALRVAKIGMGAWISIRSNHQTKQYDVFQAAWDIEPEFPSNDFSQILMLAFENRILESMDDPVVKQVLGELYYERT